MTEPYAPTEGDQVCAEDKATGFPRRGRFAYHDGHPNTSVIRLHSGSLRFVRTDTIARDEDASG